MDKLYIRHEINSFESGVERTEFVLYTNAMNLSEAEYWVSTHDINSKQGGGSGWNSFDQAKEYFDKLMSKVNR